MLLFGFSLSRREKAEGSFVIFLLGLASLVFSYWFAIDLNRNIPGTPDCLNKKAIYKVEGQIQTSDKKNIIVLKNAVGKIFCVENPKPLEPPDTPPLIVKSVKTKERWELLPKEPNE